jgi:hypothetical protein
MDHRGGDYCGRRNQRDSAVGPPGQITPLERDNSSLKLALPVVSPGLGTTKPPVLAWQPKFGDHSKVKEVG